MLSATSLAAVVGVGSGIAGLIIGVLAGVFLSQWRQRKREQRTRQLRAIEVRNRGAPRDSSPSKYPPRVSSSAQDEAQSLHPAPKEQIEGRDLLDPEHPPSPKSIAQEKSQPSQHADAQAKDNDGEGHKVTKPRPTMSFWVPAYPYPLELLGQDICKQLPELMSNSLLRDKIVDIQDVVSTQLIGPEEHHSPLPKVDRDALVKLLGSDDVDELLVLLSSDSRNVVSDAVKTVLGNAVVNRINPRGDPNTTILPPAILSAYREITQHPETEDNKLLRDIWRGITGTLLGTDILPMDDIRHERIREFCVMMQDFVWAFKKKNFGMPGDPPDNPRAEEESRVIKALNLAAVSGFKLFMQTDEVYPTWELLRSDIGTRGTIIVFPGFYQDKRRRVTFEGEVMDLSIPSLDLISGPEYR